MKNKDIFLAFLIGFVAGLLWMIFFPLSEWAGLVAMGTAMLSAGVIYKMEHT